MAKKYYLGLDIGTNSVGWCVTDENFEVIKNHVKRLNAKGEYKYYGQHLWGSRLFDDAQDASERRAHRESRRRYQRRKWRLSMLQELFKEEMDKVDPYFFERLNNSALQDEDKSVSARSPYLLFNSNGLTDKTFYQKYPTIYHLRKDMMENPKQFDIREVYLALAHMIKYRGNFLSDVELKDSKEDSIHKIKSIFDNRIDAYLASCNTEDSEGNELFNINLDQAKALKELFEKENRVSLLLEEEKRIFSINNKKDIRCNMLSLINGSSSIKLISLFDIDEDIEDKKINFADDTFMLKDYLELPSIIGDEKFNLIEALKELYDLRIQIHLLQGKTSISDAMVSLYDKHQKQLGRSKNHSGYPLGSLKDLIKRYKPEEYDNFFKKIYDENHNVTDSYASYIGFVDSKYGRYSTKHLITAEALYKRIKSLLPFDQIGKTYEWKNKTDEDSLKKIQALMESFEYLPRQNSKNNGVLPYQMNEIEMKKIIQNQGKYYKFLLDKDKDFVNPNKEEYKIVSLLKFKIPYYVGPLSGTGENHWVVRRDKEEKITPWNFSDVIDKEKTAEKFIERMKNPCTYLFGAATLPLSSLLYQEFIFLNEINKWNINGEPISLELKEFIKNKVYLQSKKPKVKMILAALEAKLGSKPVITTGRINEETLLVDENLHASLSSFVDMKDERAFGPSFPKDEEEFKLAENIICDITVFEDKHLLKERLESYKLSEKQVSYFYSKKNEYTGWGSISKEVLDGILSEDINKETGEVVNSSIIDIMRKSNLNFQEIYTSKNDDGEDVYSFKKQVEERNGSVSLTIDDIIDQEYATPGMKRALRQTFKIIQELKKILKIDKFDAYFVECTRKPDDVKKRTQSRKELLLDIYKASNQINAELIKELKNTTDEQLQSKKLFRYFLQLGKSVYTGKEIDLDNLDQYDIDHIIPQARIKDDSILNTVLVERAINNNKSDNYPIPSGCLTEEGKNWVRFLNKFNDRLMPKEKMNRILRTNPLSLDEETGFIARQLTMTNQSVKAVCDVLKLTEDNPKIVYSRADKVSDFRKFFDIPKVRDLNDMHHAHDAYLNIVVGNCYDKVFTSNFNRNILQKMKTYMESQKMDVPDFFTRDLHMFRTDTLIWKAKEYVKENGNRVEVPDSKGTIDIVRKYISIQDPMITRMLHVKNGGLSEQTIYPKNDIKGKMPLKANGPLSHVEKYGYYDAPSVFKFMLVQSFDQKKKKHKYSLECIPQVFIKDDKALNEKYLSEVNGLVEPKIILDNILINTIVEYAQDDCLVRMGISGRNDNRRLCSYSLTLTRLPNSMIKYLKASSKLLGRNLPVNSNKANLSIYEEKDEFTFANYSFSKKDNEKYLNELLAIANRDKRYLFIPSISNKLKMFMDMKNKFYELTCLEQIKCNYELTLLLNGMMVKKDICVLNQFDICDIRPFINTKLDSGTRIISPSITGFYESVFVVPND